jgi:hypothetical protein
MPGALLSTDLQREGQRPARTRTGVKIVQLIILTTLRSGPCGHGVNYSLILPSINARKTATSEARTTTETFKEPFFRVAA